MNEGYKRSEGSEDDSKIAIEEEKLRYKKVDVNEAAERLHMDNDMIEKLVKRFLDSDILEKTKRAFSEANIEEARLAIHSIKGTAANIGVKGLSKLALEIEKKIKENEYLDFELLDVMEEIWNKLKNERE